MLRPRSSRGSWFLVSTLLCGVACGGRSEHSTSSTSSDAETSSPGSDAPSNTDEDDGLDDGLDLGECTQGWLLGEAECPWLGSDELCYATKADACACVCPRDRNSTCISGLPGGPDAQTRVSCF